MKNINFPLYCNAKNCNTEARFKHTGMNIYLCVACASNPIFKNSKSIRVIFENDE